MASRLSIYNGALNHLGQRRLGSEVEDSESRRLCDELWEGGFVRYVLEEGLWTFAIRTCRVEATPNYDPSQAFPGSFKFAFEKSDDWLRTASISCEPLFNFPLTRYSDEAGFIYADTTPIWVRFTSDGPEYGSDPARWTSLFAAWAEIHMAWRLQPAIIGSVAERRELERLDQRAKRDALAKDAMQGPSVSIPRGSWVASRQGRYGRSSACSVGGSATIITGATGISSESEMEISALAARVNTLEERLNQISDPENPVAIPSFGYISVPGQADIVAEVDPDRLTFVGVGIDIATNTATDTVTFTGSGGGGAASPAYGRVSVAGQSDVVASTTLDRLTLVGAGLNITTNASNDTITFTAPVTTDGSFPAFGRISVSGQSDITADVDPDVITLVGIGIDITTNAFTDTITFSVDRSHLINNVAPDEPTIDFDYVDSGAPLDHVYRKLFAANAGSHNGVAVSPFGIEYRPVGSGTNGPTSGDFGLYLSVMKQDFGNTSVVGEIDGLVIGVRQGGVGSDCGGILNNVAHYGTGFMCQYEGISTLVTAGEIVAAVRLQCGVIDSFDVAQQRSGLNIIVEKGQFGSGLYIRCDDGVPGIGIARFIECIAPITGRVFQVDSDGSVVSLSYLACTELKVNAVKVVGDRVTFFTPMTGPINAGSPFATSTINLEQLAQRVNAIQVALTTHGLIGP